MRNFIIFGGTGFIGTHLADLLNERYPESKIWSLDIVDPSKLDVMTSKSEIEEYTTIKDWKSPVAEGKTRKAVHVQCDVRESIGTLPFEPTAEDVVFNLAAVHRTPGHPDEAYYETNIKGAENVCAFCDKYDIKNVVFTSSISIYGASENLKTEESVPQPNIPYGISKLAAEKIHLKWQSEREGRRLTILRPGVTFGKGENGNFTRLYWSLKKCTFAYPGRKDTIKACIYVKDLVRFMLWNAEERNSNVEIYNCAYYPAFTIEQIVNVMKKATSMKRFVPYIPNALIMPIAKMAQWMGSPMGICPARVEKLQISTNVCGKKLYESGFKLRWTFEEAVCDWHADNGGRYLK